mmetsp:Transcript_5044/g.12932  ORF Transcript_5044/g.12932 Transcript_5044/m.12932 type:complete len:221 (+) Transcript_5044:2544-3206(+)
MIHDTRFDKADHNSGLSILAVVTKRCGVKMLVRSNSALGAEHCWTESRIVIHFKYIRCIESAVLCLAFDLEWMSSTVCNHVKANSPVEKQTPEPWLAVPSISTDHNVTSTTVPIGLAHFAQDALDHDILAIVDPFAVLDRKKYSRCRFGNGIILQTFLSCLTMSNCFALDVASSRPDELVINCECQVVKCHYLSTHCQNLGLKLSKLLDVIMLTVPDLAR